jgi:hypothetical protein
LLLSCLGFRLFSNRLLGVDFRWRSKHRTEAGPAVLGAWSSSLDGALDILTGVEWVGLAGAWVQVRRVFSGHPTGHIDSVNRRFCVTVRLDYTLAP